MGDIKPHPPRRQLPPEFKDVTGEQVGVTIAFVDTEAIRNAIKPSN